MFGFAYSLFQAIAAIPSIINSLEQFAAGVAQWYIERTTKETLAQIADAAAFAARAETQADRLAALDKWRAVLSRPRKLI